MQYRFGPFEIDADRYELRRAGAAQPVEPLVFDLLLFLARNPGRVVTREDVVDAVWQGRAVSDATIASAVKSARRTLGDTGDTQALLRTVRGRGFEFLADVSTASATPAGEAPVPEAAASTITVRPETRPLIAVLAFENLSAGDDDYFAEGLTEDIITNLARFRDLRVLGAAVTMPFKGPDAEPTALRRRLNAGYVVRGHVRRATGRVRITAELIDAATGVRLWGERYDRDLGDIFALQDEVTRTIAATLGTKLQDVALREALRKGPGELDAYDCLLRARRFTWMLNADMHAEARDLLERAVELDPLSADAHALLANVYLGEHRFDLNPRPNPIGRALVHALAATRLDPDNAYARCWLAIVHFFRFENDKFRAEAELALRLNPNDPETLADIGHYFAFMGEFERGAHLSLRARELNPMHPGWYYFATARWHYDAGRYEAALADMQKTGMADFYWAQMFGVAAQGQLGDTDAAEALARLFTLKPDLSPVAELRKWNTAPRDLDHLLDGLRRAGWRD